MYGTSTLSRFGRRRSRPAARATCAALLALTLWACDDGAAGDRSPDSGAGGAGGQGGAGAAGGAGGQGGAGAAGGAGGQGGAGAAGGAGGQGGVGGGIDYTPGTPIDLDQVAALRDEEGGVLLQATGKLRMFVYPDRINGGARAGRCAWVVSDCLKGAGLGDLDACMAAVPVCADPEYTDAATAPCCPAECATRYRAARDAGSEDVEAFRSAMLDGTSCVPGLPEAEQ